MLFLPSFWPFRRSAAEAPAAGTRAITWDQAAAAGMVSPATAAGVSVTADSSLSCSPVYAAVRKISSAVGTLPLHLYRRMPDEGRQRADEHPVSRILTTVPNPNAVPYTFWSAAIVQMLLHGRFLAEIETNLAGDPIALWTLPANRSTTFEKPDGGLAHEIAGNTQRVILDDSQVLHVPYFSVDGTVGRGVIEYARETIGTSKACDSGGAAFLANMVRPSGSIITPPGFSEEARNNLRESIKAENSGHRRAGRLMLLEDGVKFDPMQVSNQDAQWIEARQFSIAEVARFFNISPTKLGDLGRATWGNIESENRSFIEDTLLPILAPIVQEINRKLLRPDEQPKYFAEHLLEARLRGNTTERYAAYGTAIQAGWLTRNEVRQMENRPKLDGLDTPTVPLNMAPPADAAAKPDTTPPEQTDGNPQPDAPA